MAYAALSSRAIIGRFYQRYESVLNAGWAPRIGWRNDETNMETETYKWLGQSPLMREWIGGRLQKQLATKSYSITNKPFEATLNILTEDLRRDKTGQIMLRVGELARRAAEHWEKLLSTLILDGNATTQGLCYDGQKFFDTDHSEGDSGTQINELTSTEVPTLNVTTAAAPTAIELAKAISDVVAYQYKYKDDQGEPMNGGAREFLVMVPTNLMGPALQAVASERLNSGDSNPLRAYAVGGGLTINVAVNPRLDAEDTIFYVFRVDSDMKPFILQSELDVMMKVIGAGSEEEFKNRQHLYGVEAWRNTGFGLWQFATRSTLS